MVDLIIKDEEFENFSEDIRIFADNVTNNLGDIIKCINDLIEENAIKGEFANGLLSFADSFNVIEEQLNLMSIAYEKKYPNFLSKIAILDGHLYNNVWRK